MTDETPEVEADEMTEIDDLDLELSDAEADEVDDLELIEVEDVRCVLCGWVIEDLDLSTMTDQGVTHFDRQCPKGESKTKPAATRKPRTSAKKLERKLAEGAGVVPVKGAESASKRGSHAGCEHEATKSARAACRKRRAAGE